MKRRELITATSGLVLALAGCSENDSDGEFRTEELVSTTSRATEYGEYDRKEGAAYEQGASVWFYIGIKNATPEDDVVRFNAEFEVTTPEDQTISSQEDLEIDVIDMNPENMFITNGLHTNESWPVGEYQVRVTVTDKLAQKTDSIEGNFTLE